MSRRNISKKRFPETDSVYNSYLVSLLITRILKSGKKNLAQNIVNAAFEIIKVKTNEGEKEVGAIQTYRSYLKRQSHFDQPQRFLQ